MADDPHVLGPDLTPTPFTADEIRQGCPAGRTIELLVDDPGGEPYVRFNRFVSCDADGATIERGRQGHDDVEADRVTWGELQAHAAFPAVVTTIETDTITLPLGVVDCLRYTIVDGGRVDTFWFAPDWPGMPVRITRRENGTTSTTTMIRGA